VCEKFIKRSKEHVKRLKTTIVSIFSNEDIAGVTQFVRSGVWALPAKHPYLSSA
jgi:hypothetical protein